MKAGDEVIYIGAGFIGFDKNDVSMKIIDIKTFDIRVLYKNRKMLVRNYDIVACESVGCESI